MNIPRIEFPEIPYCRSTVDCEFYHQYNEAALRVEFSNMTVSKLAILVISSVITKGQIASERKKVCGTKNVKTTESEPSNTGKRNAKLSPDITCCM